MTDYLEELEPLQLNLGNLVKDHDIEKQGLRIDRIWECLKFQLRINDALLERIKELEARG